MTGTDYTRRLRQMLTADVAAELDFIRESISGLATLVQADDLQYRDETLAFIAAQTTEYTDKTRACEAELERRRKADVLPGGRATTIDWSTKRIEILERIDIVSLIENGGVPLKRNGHGYVGLCPFHEDHNPSLHVNPDKRLWHCFGCNAGGSAFDFVMRRDNATFIESLYFLAERAGIQLPKHKSLTDSTEGNPVRESQIDGGPWLTCRGIPAR